MRKFIIGFVILPILLLSTNGWGQSYVRKQLEPQFFIPEKDKIKPENLPMPFYRSGEAETVKMVENEWGKSKQPTTEGMMDQLAETPDYQQKYDDYSRDLEHISQTGVIPENETLKEDLGQMNSAERKPVNRSLSQKRDAKAAFDRALQESLSRN